MNVSDAAGIDGIHIDGHYSAVRRAQSQRLRWLAKRIDIPTIGLLNTLDTSSFVFQVGERASGMVINDRRCFRIGDRIAAT